MSIRSRAVKGLRVIIRHRLFAAALLATVSMVMITYVSVNIRAVTVQDGNVGRVVMSLSDDPVAIMETAKVYLGEEDTFVSNLSQEDGTIQIQRAFDVAVKADGIITMVTLNGGKVSDALAKASIKVDKHDRLNVSLNAPLSEGMDIVIERVGYEEYTVSERIPFETKTEYTNTIAPGKRITEQEGAAGERVKTYRNKIVNGKVTETELVSEKVAKKPVDTIILKGTKVGSAMSSAPKKIELDEAGQPVHYKKVYTGKSTAYTNEGGRLSKWTASGRRAAVGVVAVDPSVIPYGTELYIVSPDGSYVYGYAIAGDTGGGVRSGNLVADLFMDTLDDCYRFGRRTMNVYVIE